MSAQLVCFLFWPTRSGRLSRRGRWIRPRIILPGRFFPPSLPLFSPFFKPLHLFIRGGVDVLLSRPLLGEAPAMEEAGDMHERVLDSSLLVDELEHLCGGGVFLPFHRSPYAFHHRTGDFRWSSRLGSIAQAGKPLFFEAVLPVEDLGMGAVMLFAHIVGGETVLKLHHHQNPLPHLQALLCPPRLLQNRLIHTFLNAEGCINSQLL